VQLKANLPIVAENDSISTVVNLQNTTYTYVK